LRAPCTATTATRPTPPRFSRSPAPRPKLKGIIDNYGVDDAFEAFLTDAGLNLDEAQISVSESFGEFQWNWGDCEGGLVTATFPSAQRVLVVQDMFCAG
jgi:hypothetical protein